MSDSNSIAIPLPRLSQQIFPAPDGGKGWLDAIFTKENLTPKDGQSAQHTNLGRRPWPFDVAAVKKFLTANEHHSTCIATKTAATVGLGFQTDKDKQKAKIGMAGAAGPGAVDPSVIQGLLQQSKEWKPTKADEALDPLCMHSLQDLLNDVCEDYHQTNGGFIEVVRKAGGAKGPITGLHYLPAEFVHIFVEDASYNFHYEIEGEGTTKHFAVFGDKERMMAAQGGALVPFEVGDVPEAVSEVIHIRKPSSLDRWYSVPKWLACTASVELVQMLTQYKFDFFLNRCVPELMLFIIGTQLGKEEKTQVENALKAGIGLGNAFKSLFLNLPGSKEQVEVKLEKMIADAGKEDSWGKDNEACALKIVTAHQVPPLLAGIQIPGKLGANNELPNALMAFQALCIGQDQRLWERKLVSTLGAEKSLGLKPEDFLFRTILDEIDLGMADTVGRMKQPVAEAKAQGRDVSAGVKD